MTIADRFDGLCHYDQTCCQIAEYPKCDKSSGLNPSAVANITKRQTIETQTIKYSHNLSEFVSFC